MLKILSAAAAVGFMFVLGSAAPSAAGPVAHKGLYQKSEDLSARRRHVRRQYHRPRVVYRRVIRRYPYPYYRPYYAYRPYPYYYRPYAYAPIPFLPFGIGFGYGYPYWW
ncbi:MAG TPA: hypothetical protein VFQ27_06355 [Xanthobacteraceae bacterium]|nr:hypothetical protein [Xanthobacteraceae bacterium]